jgi:hypothetical protein
MDAERFWDRCDLSGGPDACWPWTGARTSWGYGNTRVDGKTVGTHRVAWQLTHGPIPAGMSVLHRCDNPPCCNPRHLFLGSPLDNKADSIAKGRDAHRSPFLARIAELRRLYDN